MTISNSYIFAGYVIACLSCLGSSLSPPLDVCVFPAEMGPCEAAIPRWFHNTSSNRCEMFTYGGCDGNGNNFETEEACIGECECSRRPGTGPCDGNYLRWYFNGASGKCERFTYGGCDGNANNFETRLACEQRCGTSGCGDKPNEECDRKGRKLRRWKYNIKPSGQGVCKRFRWKRCESQNVFSSKAQCLHTCDQDLCPVLNCDLNCPFGYNSDDNGCQQCCCAVGPCPGVDCCPGYECRTDLGVCERITCPANQRFDTCCPSPSCDRDCSTADDNIICTQECSERCCCPPDKPILAADGVTCLTRDQCPPANVTCPANQVYNGCCSACPRSCSQPNPGICITLCVQGCCCPPDRPFLADDGVTCVRGTECPLSVCAAVSCLLPSVCDPDTGSCV